MSPLVNLDKRVIALCIAEYNFVLVVCSVSSFVFSVSSLTGLDPKPFSLSWSLPSSSLNFWLVIKFLTSVQAVVIVVIVEVSTPSIAVNLAPLSKASQKADKLVLILFIALFSSLHDTVFSRIQEIRTQDPSDFAPGKQRAAAVRQKEAFKIKKITPERKAELQAVFGDEWEDHI